MNRRDFLTTAASVPLVAVLPEVTATEPKLPAFARKVIAAWAYTTSDGRSGWSILNPDEFEAMNPGLAERFDPIYAPDTFQEMPAVALAT